MKAVAYPILCFKDAKRLDNYAQEKTKIDGNQWMGWAALSIFHKCQKLFLSHSEILILCGSGNNGGDGYALAYFLQSEGQSVRIFSMDSPKTQESIYYSNIITQTKVAIHRLDDLWVYLQESPNSKLIVDCLFGIGGRLPLSEELQKFLNRLCLWKKTNPASHFLSIDVVTGRSAWYEWEKVSYSSSDQFLKNEISSIFPADSLAEIGTRKWENFGFPKQNKIYIPIGFPFREFIENRENEMSIHLLEPDSRESVLSSFSKSNKVHKYQAGSCLFYGAEEGMEGAILLSLSAFHGLGGGISKVKTISEKIWKLKEAENPSYMIDSSSINYWEDSFFLKSQGMVWGPGTIVPQKNKELVTKEWENISRFPEKYFIIDAGRIPSFSIITDYPNLIFHPKCILTAHFGEFNRLTQCGTKKWEDRVSAGLNFSKKLNCNILLKESYSLLFTPTAEIYLWDEPNSKLATMGTGDLLTGIIALYLSRNYSIVNAIHSALSTIHLTKEMPYHSPTAWEILEYLKKV